MLKKYFLIILLGFTASILSAQSDVSKYSIKILFITHYWLGPPPQVITISNDSITISIRNQIIIKGKDKPYYSYKDSIVFTDKNNISFAENLNDIDTVNQSFFNLCIIGGWHLYFTAEYDEKKIKKTIHSGYEKNIYEILAQLDQIIPEKYRFHFNAEAKLKELEECEKWYNPD